MAGCTKGDALAVARIAGIMAAKKTPDLVPLAHPVAVHAVDVDLDVVDTGVAIEARVRTADRTGIEMEALTAVAVAGLALIDMVKALDRHTRLGDIRVVAKSSGWLRELACRQTEGRALVVTASDRAATGGADGSGPVLVEGLRELAARDDLALAIEGPRVVPDGEQVGAALAAAIAAGCLLVVTTGGTGVASSDRTPDVTAPLLDRELPGVAEAIRAYGVAAGVPTAMLSRGLARDSRRHRRRRLAGLDRCLP